MLKELDKVVKTKLATLNDQQDLLYTARASMEKAVARAVTAAGDETVRDASVLLSCLDAEYSLAALKETPPSLWPLCSSAFSFSFHPEAVLQAVAQIGEVIAELHVVPILKVMLYFYCIYS